MKVKYFISRTCLTTVMCLMPKYFQRRKVFCKFQHVLDCFTVYDHNWPKYTYLGTTSILFYCIFHYILFCVGFVVTNYWFVFSNPYLNITSKYWLCIYHPLTTSLLYQLGHFTYNFRNTIWNKFLYNLSWNFISCKAYFTSDILQTLYGPIANGHLYFNTLILLGVSGH